jgi:Na+/H+ antiporter NhaD/arsenite permease-like protein
MRTTLLILFLSFVSLTGIWAEDAPAAESRLTAPEWAQPAQLQQIRGRFDGKILIESITQQEFLLENPAPFDPLKFANLDIEVKGWTGTHNSAQSIQASSSPHVLISPFWSLPFLLLLACIACMPFINKKFWEHNYHRVSVGLAVLVGAAYVVFFGHYGSHRMGETALEYFKFMALVGSLFVVSGGILIEISGHGTPVVNTLLLATGALLANVFGTTGASALLIRPFLRINQGRLRPFHVVMFIFIVSNCGGALTPIGDPPLFLGYIYGVPFHWTLVNCWGAWLLTIGLLLAVFFVLDRADHDPALSKAPTRVTVKGAVNFLCLGLILLGVFADKLLAEYVSPNLESYPIGALVMLTAAFAGYRLSKPEYLSHNEFSFGPIKEVAFLFAGIFATMVPALDYLAANAQHLGIQTPGAFYFGSGLLSSFLDNAPTYLNFLTAAHGLKDATLSKAGMPMFLAQYPQYLVAVSLGSVFFGACTYIGNGPNFMVKSIADASGAQTPSFFGYIFKYTLPILVPIYTLVWLIFLS